MKYLVLFYSLIATQAYAHIEAGTYQGLDPNGKDCSMIAGENFFEGSPHPLNERIRIKIMETDFVVAHPAVLDFPRSSVSFNHNLFHAVKSTPTGAIALEIEMMHTEEHEGPIKFSMIENNWKTGDKKSLFCDGIELKK